MIDKIAIILTHVLMALAAWRLMLRDDLDPPTGPRRPVHKRGEPEGLQTDAPDGTGQGDA